MKSIITFSLSFIYALMLIGTVHAEYNLLKGTKLGFGLDRGLGIVGTTGNLNGFIGNNGITVDYILMKKKLDTKEPLNWYVGGGGYRDWDSDLGVRLPVGVEFYFAKNLDAYAHVIPHLRLNNSAKFKLDLGIGVRYQF